MDQGAAGETMLDFIAEHTSDVFVRVDRDGLVTYASPSIRIYGYSPAEVVGTSGIQLTHPDDQARFAANMAAILRGEARDAADRQHRFLTASGGWVWVEGNPQPVFDADGQVSGLVTVFRNVTGRRATETALRESEARYRMIAESMTDIVVQADLNGVLTYASPSVRAYGYRPEDLVGLHADALLNPDDAARVIANRALVAGGLPAPPDRERQNRFRTADGGWVWLEGHPQILRGPDGQPAGVMNVLRDVTERRAQTDLFEAAFNSAPVIMVLADMDFAYVRANPEACRVMGYSEDEFLKLSAADIVHPDEAGSSNEDIRRLLAGEITHYECERRYRRADGEYLWLRIAVALVRNADGSPKHYINYAQDQTAHRAAHAAARDSEARYRVIAEQTSDIIAMSDRNAKVTYMSPSIGRLGYVAEELLGKAFAEHVHPDDVEALNIVLRSQKRGDDPTRVRWRARHQVTGAWVWMESEPRRLWHPETGEANGFLDVVRDVSQQVAQEEALAQARNEAEAAATVKSQFLANMSHEIRTPLTAVLGYTEILEAAPQLDDKLRSYVQRIAGAGSALLAIVNDILDFSKLEAGMVEVRPQPTDLVRLLEDTLALFEARTAEKGLALTCELAADVPATVMLDTDRLRQILLNLTGNAVKFTDAGEVAVRVTVDGEALRFEVEDTGPGLDAPQCARLFQRFNQIDGTTTRKHGGTGLGLAISKGLAEAMGGAVGVTSVPGKGSIFHLTLPLVAVADETAPAAAPDIASIAGLRVLVVDDNATNRELARRILEAFGAQVSDADGGVEALAQLAALPVDAVLMDLRMPDMDGRDALARLRAGAGPNRDAPVLAFTADAELGDGAGLEAFDGLVRKPIDTLALVESLAVAVMAAGEISDARDRAAGA